MEETMVLCGANSYVEKYYFNEKFKGLPEAVKEELQIMCVMFTEDVGGVLTLEFTPEGELQFKVASADTDYLFDEIGSALKIKQYQREKRELLESLELHQKDLNKQERWEKAVSLLKLVGISSPEERMKEYPHQFSGGMRQRVIIAIALATNPALIIADEPTTALDVTVQSQIVWELKELVHREHSSLIMITHDIALISQIAENIIVMYCGKVIESGTMEDIIFHAKHPYTQGLLHSIPTMTDSENRLEPIKGIVPSMFDLPKGCKFAPRCEHCKGICLEKEPEKVSLDGHHTVCCHLYTEGRS